MGISSKVFAGIEQDVDVVRVLKAVKEAIDSYSREKLGTFIKSSNGKYAHRFQTKAIKEDTGLSFSNGSQVSTDDFECFSFVFGCGDGFVRNLFCCTECHEDYEDVYVGNKITFLLGCSGSNQEIMNVICSALVPFGKVFYDINDCDAIDFQEYHGEIE